MDIRDRSGRSRRRRWARSGGRALLTLLLSWVPVVAATAATADGEAAKGDEARPVLATPGQLEIEALVVDILRSPSMQRATDALEQTYLAHPRGQTPSGRATARRAAEATAAAAAVAVANGDPARPVVFWGIAPPHAWYGLSLPRSGYGIENPDNVYRSFPVDGASRYVVTGRIAPPGPAELHFVVMDMRPQKGRIAVEAGAFLASLRSDAMEIDADGRFTIEIDAAPANGRKNHLQIPSEGRFPVHVRDLFTDWSRQTPAQLEVRRVAGPPAPPRDDVAKLAARAAERLAQMGPFWLDYNDQHLYSRPANAFDPPRLRPGGRGVSASGHFELADDQALILTMEPLGARSIGIQLADPWGVAYAYEERTSSLNQDQAVPNADGSFTYVIAARDPLVHNWLDPDGQSAGIAVARWQVLAADPEPGAGIREMRVVPLDELRAALPAEARWITAEERIAQRSERARQFRRRLEP